ncbi:hypothetical protein JW756_02355 [Candidatus Woesearchaeota archaeon]|nr:hypothetical protein [Candidatus Woesearchaeota archaeon]
MKLFDYQKIFEEHVSEYNLLPKKAVVYVLVSGGRDSVAMSYLFNKYANKREDLKIKYLNVVFPQMVFGHDKKEIDNTVKKISNGLPNFTPGIARTSYEKLRFEKHPCLLCKELRRKIIAEIISNEKKKNVFIATAHNSHDLLSYFTEIFNISFEELTGKGIKYKQLPRIRLKDEQLEHFSHFFPKIELDSGIKLIHPMLSFSRLEVDDLLSKLNIPIFLEPCPYANERPKRVFFNLLKTLPIQKIESLVQHNSYKAMLSAIQEKAENYGEALKKLEKTNYSNLLF